MGDADGAASAASVAAASRFAASVSAILRRAAAASAAEAAAAAANPDANPSALADPTPGLLALSRAIWDLSALYFVEPGDGTGVVADRLSDWYRRNAADVATSPDALPERLRALLAAIADAGAKPEEAPGYWECFASLAALGWTDAAVDLAALHSCWEEWRVGKASARPMAELLEAAVALVRTAPRLGRADSDADADADAALGDDDDGQTRAANPPATSVPQFLAFREAWTRQIREVLADAALFDGCGDVSAAEGVRAALSAMAGDETAVSRAAPGGWLELMVAEARCRYPLARAAGDHAAIARRCVAARGPGASEEMDRLLLAVVDADAAAVVAACAEHLDAWFLAHLAEMLVAAAGEGHRVGRADPTAGALRREGVALAGGGFRPGSGAAVTAKDAPTGAVLRRPTATLRGGNQAELYLVEYCAALATRPGTRGLALRYAARAATRGASLAAATLRASAPPPGAFSAAAEARERDPDGAFAATFEVLETCRAMGLPSVALGVARVAASDARARGDATGAAAWLHRAGDLEGVAAAAAEQLPTPEMAATDPGAAAATLERLAAEHPASEGGSGVSGWDGSAAFAASGPAGFLDAAAALRATERELAAAGANAATTARAAAEVASPATAATARRAGAIVAALLSHGAGQKHLWAESLFRATPLLEGALAAMEPAEIQLCIARLEQIEAEAVMTRGDLEGPATTRALATEADLRVAAARNALARAYARACVAPRGRGGGRAA